MPAPVTPAVTDGEFDRYWQAVLAGDDLAALATARTARTRGVPHDHVLLGLVARAQDRVGALWATNEWTVAREHAATAVSDLVLRELGADLRPPQTGPLLLVGCVEREWHALGAHLVSQILTSWGHRVEYLGPNVAREQLIGRIADTGPRAVLLSASLTSSLPRARRIIESVRGTGTPVIVGGQAFDAAGVRARRLGATAYAADPAAAAALLTTLPTHVSAAPLLRHPGAIEARGLEADADAISRAVASDTSRALPGDVPGEVFPDDWRVVLRTYVPHIVDCLVGALQTEDPTVLLRTRDWLLDILLARGADPTAVDVLWSVLAAHLRDYPEARALLGHARGDS